MMANTPFTCTSPSNEGANTVWRKTRNKIILVNAIIAIIVMTIIISLPILVHQQSKASDIRKTATEKAPVHKLNICSSQPCLKEAVQILQQINPDADPCEDFHAFVCGNMWKRLGGKIGFSYELEDEIFKQVIELYEEPNKDTDHIMVKKIKELYHACNKKYQNWDLTTLSQLLAIAGSWPMLKGKNWDETKFDWVEEMYKFREIGFPHSQFFDVSIVVHPKNKSEYIFQVTLTTIELVEKEIMIEIAQILEIDQHISLAEIEEVHHWKELVTIDASSLGADTTHNMLTVSEFQKKQPNINFNWLRFINMILSPATQITKNTFVLFPQPQQVSTRLQMLARSSKRAQANYIMWKIIEGAAPDLILALKRKQYGGRGPTRQKQCVEFIQQRFVPSPIDVIYAKRYLPAAKINLLDEIAANIKVELLELLKKSDLLDIVDKTVAIKTLNELTVIMGAPKNYFSPDQILDDLLIDMYDSYSYYPFVGRMLQMERNYQTFWYKQIHKPVVQWKLRLTTTSTLHYDDGNNVMVIPASILRGVMFNENRPNALNYGHLGTWIGTDLLGSLFLKKRKEEDELYALTWSNNTIQAVGENINCLANQTAYTFGNNYDHESLTFYTWEYNMAVKASYLAYKKLKNNNGDDTRLVSVNYTSNQLYWISSVSYWCYFSPFAKMDSMDLNYKSFQFSIIGHNNLNFARDFSCPVGSQMNSGTNCTTF